MKPNDLVKLNSIIQRIQAGLFGETDVDNLLMYLRDFAGKDQEIFLEVAHFVAHSHARDRGLALQSIVAIVDSIQYSVEYINGGSRLNLAKPFPAYIHRLFISQAGLSDEQHLKKEHKMSRAELIKKIKASFVIDKATKTCSLQDKKGGVELLDALRYLTSFVNPKPAFHIRDFHMQLKHVMRVLKVNFDEEAWDAQVDRISLAILCLISNTKFVLPGGGEACCKLVAENEIKIVRGQQRTPFGGLSAEPDSFGKLVIMGEAAVYGPAMAKYNIGIKMVITDLDPNEHCDPTLFERGLMLEGSDDCEVDSINFADDMSLSADFKLVRTDSLTER